MSKLVQSLLQDDDEEEEEDDDDINRAKKRRRMMLLTMVFHDDRKEKRRDIRRDGMWHEHIQKLEHLGEAEFISRYTMTKTAFTS